MFVTIILSKIRAYRRYREAIREAIGEPMPLTDREFGDIAVTPYYIDVIAPERHLITRLLNKSTS
jgi:uncharacterized protein YjiS (DUF1127 family)